MSSDSFHPLLPEVTHNETADPSVIFNLPEHSGPNSPEGHGVPPPPELSPELLRTDDLCRTASPSLHQSFSQLLTSQCHAHDSVLTVDPTAVTDVEQTAAILSHLTVCDETSALKKISGRHEDSARDLKSTTSPVSDKILV